MSSSDANGLSIKQTSAFSTFKVKKPAGETRGRAKLPPKRRQEADAVRKKRACLRCSLLRIKCSDDDICTTCEKLASTVHAHERRTLSFCACIRTWLIEVNIFGLFVPCENIRPLVLEKGSMLASTPISLGFASKIKWDIGSLIDDIVHWFKDPLDSTTSKVGTLSSPSFLDLLEPFVEARTRTNFQCMIYAESLAYTQPTAPDRHFLSCSELRQIGAMAGQDILKFLDKRLKPESLKHCSQEDVQALSLMIVGTILAVGYTTPSDDTENLNEVLENSQPRHPAGFQPTQDFLIRILAHYMIYLGAILKLPIGSHIEQFIIQSAPKMWNKEGVFQWTSTSGDNPGIEDNLEYSRGMWACGSINSIGMNCQPGGDLLSILDDVSTDNESFKPGFSAGFPVGSEYLCTSSVQAFDETDNLLLTDLEPYLCTFGDSHGPLPQQSLNVLDGPYILSDPGLPTSIPFHQDQEGAIMPLVEDILFPGTPPQDLWSNSSSARELRDDSDGPVPDCRRNPIQPLSWSNGYTRVGNRLPHAAKCPVSLTRKFTSWACQSCQASTAKFTSCPQSKEPYHRYLENTRAFPKGGALRRVLQCKAAEYKLGACRTFDTWETENDHDKRREILGTQHHKSLRVHCSGGSHAQRDLDDSGRYNTDLTDPPDIPRNSFFPSGSASVLRPHGISQPVEKTICYICGTYMDGMDGGRCPSCTRGWNEILESQRKKREWRPGAATLGHAMTAVRQFLLV